MTGWACNEGSPIPKGSRVSPSRVERMSGTRGVAAVMIHLSYVFSDRLELVRIGNAG